MGRGVMISECLRGAKLLAGFARHDTPMVTVSQWETHLGGPVAGLPGRGRIRNRRGIPGVKQMVRCGGLHPAPRLRRVARVCELSALAITLAATRGGAGLARCVRRLACEVSPQVLYTLLVQCDGLTDRDIEQELRRSVLVSSKASARRHTPPGQGSQPCAWRRLAFRLRGRCSTRSGFPVRSIGQSRGSSSCPEGTASFASRRLRCRRPKF